MNRGLLIKSTWLASWVTTLSIPTRNVSFKPPLISAVDKAVNEFVLSLWSLLSVAASITVFAWSSQPAACAGTYDNKTIMPSNAVDFFIGFTPGFLPWRLRTDDKAEAVLLRVCSGARYPPSRVAARAKSAAYRGPLRRDLIVWRSPAIQDPPCDD